MKVLDFLIDKCLTVFAYMLVPFCFYLVLYTDVSGPVCIEGLLLTPLSLFARDAWNLYITRKNLNSYGFEDELFR